MLRTRLSFVIIGFLAGAALLLICGAVSSNSQVGTYQMVIGPNYWPSSPEQTECPYVVNTRTGEVWRVSLWRDDVQNVGGYSWSCFGSPESSAGYLGRFGDMNLGQFSAYQKNARIYLRKTGVGFFPQHQEEQE